LGSTGSIGVQALDVIATHPTDFSVVGLAAQGTRPELLADQVAATGARRVALPDEAAAARVEALLAARRLRPVTLTAGATAVADLAATPCDVVLNAVTGFAGLTSSLAALRAGTRLALANKESLVVGGRFLLDRAGPGQLTPVDSEHSAFAQALRAGRADEVSRLILTASGGPFRGWTRSQLAHVTAAQALAHPTWAMGRTITINSATLVNKGLELIEASLLFDVPLDAITVVVHPQSQVHSMVEFRDGATLAMASPPDMRLPIALGLAWPHRLGDVIEPCRWDQPTAWTFEPLDETVFPAVALARRVGRAGGTAPAVFNAANEVVVDAFCAGQIGFLDITATLSAVVDRHLAPLAPGALGGPGAPTAPDGEAVESAPGRFAPDSELSLAVIEAADAWARAEALGLIDARRG